MQARRGLRLELSIAFIAVLVSSPLAAQLIFADDFESGNTSAWTSSTGEACTPACGSTELCDLSHLGFDDNCDGVVDEGCSCLPGTAQSCFAGDPSFLPLPGCFAGTQHCTEAGVWGACVGGVQLADGCDSPPLGVCRGIETNVYLPTDLASGLGSFGDDAITESWDVACPGNLATCPAPSASSFTPIVYGEHLVTYSKTTSSLPPTATAQRGAAPEQCTYGLFVAGPSDLRVELQWEFDRGADLDLHLHQPNSFLPWGGDSGNAVDCAWSNCQAASFDPSFPTGVDWFSGAAPPDPVDWWLDPVFENNVCYFAPRGIGSIWQSYGLGCHNPRQEIDVVACDPATTDPQDNDFCTGEATAVDFMPRGEWTRIGVHYFNGLQMEDVHPAVKIFCSGHLAAELGPFGYHDPESPVTFAPGGSGTAFWLVADVLHYLDGFGATRCLVQPIYADEQARSPFVSTVPMVQTVFGPPNPPQPPAVPPVVCTE